MNEYDSDFLAQSLMQEGFVPESQVNRADLILINTCAVRAKPEQKAVSFLGRLAAIKRKNPRLIVGMVGCLAQMKGPEIMKRFPLLDFVMGPRELGRITEVVDKHIEKSLKTVAIALEGVPSAPVRCAGYFKGQTSGFISIMEGCNNFCSYCIVPYVRGREVFRDPQAIRSEAEYLLREGISEITLLGQNVNSYVWREPQEWRFPDLLHYLADLEGLSRLRFTTSHPKDLSENLVACFRDLPVLAQHIHLPFQAGSNRVLKRMRRGYTREAYLELIEKLRCTNPDIAITSDVMVGFPDETHEDFLQTLDLIESVSFDGLFSFIYSDREGTPAARMPGKVSAGEKAERLQILQELQNRVTLKRNQALLGRKLAVLVEGTSKKGGQLSRKNFMQQGGQFRWRQSESGTNGDG